MNVLEDLKARWALRDTYESGVQQRIWDRRAEDFKTHPLPLLDVEKDVRRICFR